MSSPLDWIAAVCRGKNGLTLAGATAGCTLKAKERRVLEKWRRCRRARLATAYITKFECTFSLPFAVKRLKFRRGSKGSSDSEVRRLPSNSRQTSSNTRRSGQESSLSTRSSCNLIDSVQLAALERAVMDQGARVVNSVAGGSGCSSAVTSKVGFSGETAKRGGASDVDVAGAETTHELVPADHPAPLRRASATPKTSKGATRGSASLGGRDVETQTTRSDLKMTTSARIGPGIQALIADYGAASGTQFPGGFGDNVAFQETVAARLFASVGGGGVGLRGRGGDAGRASANGVATKGHRTHHRSDSGGVRRVVREHKETLRKAAAAAAVVKVAGGEGHRADGQEEGKKDGGVASATRRRVPPDPKGKVRQNVWPNKQRVEGGGGLERIASLSTMFLRRRVCGRSLDCP